MSTDTDTPVVTEEAQSPSQLDAQELAARVELLETENRRLREAYVRARQAGYRRSAVGFLALGLVALGGAALLPSVRTVLVALGGTGCFGAVVTYYLTPERFVSASVGETVYDALAANGEALVAELGLEPDRVYVPVGETSGSVRLFVPQHGDAAIPADDALSETFVVGDEESSRGIAVEPTGDALFREFEAALDGPLAADVGELAAQLRDGVVEQFELARAVDVDVDATGGRLTAEVVDSVYSDVSRFDHPIASLLGVGVARALDVPTRVEVTDATGDAAGSLLRGSVSDTDGATVVTVRWDSDATDAEGAASTE